MTVLVCLIFLNGCAEKNHNIVGIMGDDFGTVGIDKKACDIPDGFIYMSPKVLDTYVESKIEVLK